MNKSESRYYNTAVKLDKALLALLEQKPFEYITVSEICREAGVNRSTFYLHYENTRDLLEETSRYVFDRFLSYFSADNRIISEGFSECEMKDLNFMRVQYLHPYLRYIRENKRIFQAVLSHPTDFRFESVFKSLFDNVFNPILDRFGYSVHERRYIMVFYLTGVTAVTSEWLMNGCEQSIEEMSEIIQRCILGNRECEDWIKYDAGTF